MAGSTGAAPAAKTASKVGDYEVLVGGTRLYALGFSPGRDFAWLERRVGVDSDDNTWLLHILNLDNDLVLAEREYTAKAATIEALCAQHGTAIARVLDRFPDAPGEPAQPDRPVGLLESTGPSPRSLS